MLLKFWLHQNQNVHYVNLLYSLLCFEKYNGNLHEKISRYLKITFPGVFWVSCYYTNKLKLTDHIF